MSYEFQMIALIFMRDWYQISAMSFTGEIREELKRRSETVQNLIDRMAYGGAMSDVRGRGAGRGHGR